MSATRSICVYCGSRSGRSDAYARAAAEFGRAIAAEGWRLVYGAGDIGLMGQVAAAAQAAGAQTLGVLPQQLIGRERGRSTATTTTLIVTEDLHARKRVMFMNADAIVVMPGGAGSLDEFFEVLTWRQIGLHEKPIFLANIAGYWDPLVRLVEHVIAEGFAEPQLAGYCSVVADVPTLTARLRIALS
jgi:uncharacterized protein (TIGR00730 family)